jgi:uncharacterized OB-fold protein
MTESNRWLPEPDDSNRPYFDGARAGTLRLQRCDDCSGFMFPVRRRCQHCGSTALAWAEASGRGTLYAHGQLRRSYHPRHQLRHDSGTPVLMAQVDLEEGVRMNANLVDCAPDQVRVGMAVIVTFEISPAGEAIPMFRPA